MKRKKILVERIDIKLLGFIPLYQRNEWVFE